MKRVLMMFVMVALLFLPMLYYSPTNNAFNPHLQQDPPRWDCCYQIWATGSNLGWASSFLYYTTVRTRLEPPDQNWIDDLNRARQHVQAANTVCSAFNPAWKDWSGKQAFLEQVTNSVIRRPVPIIRKQAASSIGSTFGWANSLRVRVIQQGNYRREYEHDTCAEKYYKLGFLLGYAHQTMLIAQEAQQNGRFEWVAQVNDAHAKLRQSLQVLEEYFNIEGCTNIVDLNIAARIENVLNADSRQLPATIQELRGIWESFQQRLISNCELALGPTPTPTPTPGGRFPPRNRITYFTDPPTTIYLVGGGTEVVLYKELSGYANYGFNDGRADILYDGETATWNFVFPQNLDPRRIRSAFFRAALVGDDHYNQPLNQYSLSVWTNGVDLGDNPANLPHGSPYGRRFTNWTQQDFAVTGTTGQYTITLSNTSRSSGTVNWVAVDWIELHLLID